jgi:hypothetical protein
MVVKRDSLSLPGLLADAPEPSRDELAASPLIAESLRAKNLGTTNPGLRQTASNRYNGLNMSVQL